MRRGFRKRFFLLNVRRMRPHERNTPAKILLLFLVLGLGLSGYYYITTMRPLLEQYAESELRNRLNLMINRVVEEEITAGEVTYDSLIRIEKDEDGRIMSLTTNVGAMNTLKVRIESKIVEKILENQNLTVRIPMGSLFGNEFLSGRGPRITVKVVPMAEVFASYDNTFASAGINQTRHQIYMKYDVKVRMLLPGRQKGTTVTSSVCVAETIIVGATPQFFAGEQK